MILDKIVAFKRRQLDAIKAQKPLAKIKQEALTCKAALRSFNGALTRHSDIAIIGEVKKASPSKGLIRSEFDPKTIAEAYAKASVQALSVLTETEFFSGHPDYLKTVRAASGLPVLRKDFIIDAWQIFETRLMDADAMLLITAILDDQMLTEFIQLAKSLGIDALVEVHNEHELKRALKADSEIIGINNRDLNNFTVSIETSEKLIPMIPKDRTVVSESGIHTYDDLMRMQTAGADALLIGEAFMKESDITGAVKKMRGRND